MSMNGITWLHSTIWRKHLSNCSLDNMKLLRRSTTRNDYILWVIQYGPVHRLIQPVFSWNPKSQRDPMTIASYITGNYSCRSRQKRKPPGGNADHRTHVDFQRCVTGIFPIIRLAQVYIMVGMHNAALTDWNTPVASCSEIHYLNSASPRSIYDPLRNHPRFQAFLTSMMNATICKVL